MMLVSDSYALDQDIQRAQSFLPAGDGGDAGSHQRRPPSGRSRGQAGEGSAAERPVGGVGSRCSRDTAVATPVPPPPPETGFVRRSSVYATAALSLFSSLCTNHSLSYRPYADTPRPEECRPLMPRLSMAAHRSLLRLSLRLRSGGRRPDAARQLITTYKLGENTYDESFSIETRPASSW